MLQRIQTIYLLLAGISIGLLFIFDFSVIENIKSGSEDTVVHPIVKPVTALNVFGFTNEDGTTPNTIPYTFPLLTGLVLILILFCILKYKNRILQIKICQINMLLMLAILLLIFYETDKYVELYLLKEGIGYYKFGTALPILGVIFNLLASRAIKKDEELVRSANRIR